MNDTHGYVVDPTAPRYITIKQAAEMLDTQSWPIVKRIDSGEFRTVRYGKRLLVSAEDVVNAGREGGERDCTDADAAAAEAGQVIASNIAHHLDRLDWDYDRLADASGLSWGDVVTHRADAGAMSVDEMRAIARALGVLPSDLAKVATA